MDTHSVIGPIYQQTASFWEAAIQSLTKQLKSVSVSYCPFPREQEDFSRGGWLSEVCVQDFYFFFLLLGYET